MNQQDSWWLSTLERPGAAKDSVAVTGRVKPALNGAYCLL